MNPHHSMRVSNPAALECYLPFKLFRSQSTEPSFQPSPMRKNRAHTSMEYTPVQQMEHFVSETAQSMVGFHATKCTPVRAGGSNEDIYQMETLSDLMKKHKDAFHREYDEFGPVSEWSPEASSSSIPGAARELGKHFDLRGELATIQHVRRTQCRLRNPSPMLLNRMNTPYHLGRPKRSSSTLPQSSGKQASQESRVSTPTTDFVTPGSHPNPDDRFPSSLQFLYLPPARSGIAIVETNPNQNKEN